MKYYIDKILETYEPALIRWRVDNTTKEAYKILILRKQICEGATEPTYICRDSRNNRKFICGVEDNFHSYETKLEAVTVFRADYIQGIKCLQVTIEAAKSDIDKYEEIIRKLTHRITVLTEFAKLDNQISNPTHSAMGETNKTHTHKCK